MDAALLVHVFIYLLLLLILLININKIQKFSANKWELIKFVLFIPVLLLLFILTMLAIPLEKLIHMIVAAVLKIKFGNDYYDLVTGMDLIMGCNDWQHSFIKFFLVIEHNKTVKQQSLFEYTKELIEENRAQKKFHKKFFATLDQRFGYLFFKKIDLETSDCVRKMPLNKKTLDRNELLHILVKSSYEPLPLNNTALWDIQVGTQSLQWRSNSDPNIEYFPILIRAHHSIADGTCLVKHLIYLFASEVNNDHSEPDLKQKSISCVHNLFKQVIMFFKFLILFISVSYISLFMRGHDSNDLHGKPITNNDVIQFVTDDDGSYFKKLKKITKIHGDVRFSDVVISAYSASLYEFYQKYLSINPPTMTISVPVILNRTYFQGIKSQKIENIYVGNKFTLLAMELPMNINKNFNSKTNSLSRLNIVRKTTKDLRNIGYKQFSYIFENLFLGSLPVSVLRIILTTFHHTTLGSFLPGSSKFSFKNEAFALYDCIFWPPHICQVGLGFTILTFDNRLQMGLTYNGGNLKQSHVDEILQNVYKHIDLIDEELVQMKYTKN